MTVQVWLVPVENKMEKISASGNAQNKVVHDTSSFHSILMSSLALPEAVRLELEQQFRNSQKKLDFVGPIRGNLGTWYFKIKKVKIGGIPVPFYVVQREIIDNLVKPYLHIDTINSEKAEKLKFESGLAQAYKRDKAMEIENLSNENVQQLINQGVIDTSKQEQGFTKDEKLNYAREKYGEQMYEKNQAILTEWLSNIHINKAVLFY
jgi:hypothetical protein